jgi:predicted glycosyltransferase
MYYLTYTEYEKAKRCIFTDKALPAEHKQQLGEKAEDGGSVVVAEFHPILLSSLLNQ